CNSFSSFPHRYAPFWYLTRKKNHNMKLNTDLCGDSSCSRNGYHQSAWHTVLNAVLEPRTINLENDIIEYLDCHRHDLPPASWIELENRCPSLDVSIRS